MTAWEVAPGEDGMRLDHFVAARTGASRAAARRLLDGGGARIDGRRAPKGATVRAGQRVTVEAALPGPGALTPLPDDDAPLDVLHEDADVLALAKPAGIATHPLRPGERGTLANRLVARYPECAGVGDDPREAGLAHRLDRETSGVVLAARNAGAWRALRASFHDGRVTKEYLALVAGQVMADGVVDAPLAHDPRDRRRVLVARAGSLEGRPATTRYVVCARTPAPEGDVAEQPAAGDPPLRAPGPRGCSLLRAVATTGRMHQVRAHLAHIGHPLVGDALYGGPPELADAPGHFLHAARVELPHPRGGRLDVTAPLPPDRAAALARLGLARS